MRTLLKTLSLSIAFVPADVWIGVYVDRGAAFPIVMIESGDVGGWCRWWTVYVCLLPMLPIRIRWARLRYD